MASIERIRFFDIPSGSDLEFTTSNAGDTVIFQAKLIEGGASIITWPNDEIWNDTAAAVLEDSMRKRLQLDAAFTGITTFDFTVKVIAPGGSAAQSAERLGLTDHDLVRIVVSCNMTGA